MLCVAVPRKVDAAVAMVTSPCHKNTWLSHKQHKLRARRSERGITSSLTNAVHAGLTHRDTRTTPVTPSCHTLTQRHFGHVTSQFWALTTLEDTKAGRWLSRYEEEIPRYKWQLSCQIRYVCGTSEGLAIKIGNACVAANWIATELQT